jgi:hypothetical protein
MKPMLESLRNSVTPVLITIGIFYLGGIKSDISKIDDKLFRHLTNDEIHAPRTMVVNKSEFEIYQIMRDRQMTDLKDITCRIEAKVDKIKK